MVGFFAVAVSGRVEVSAGLCVLMNAVLGQTCGMGSCQRQGYRWRDWGPAGVVDLPIGHGPVHHTCSDGPARLDASQQGVPHRGRATCKRQIPCFACTGVLTCVLLQTFNEVIKEYQQETGKTLDVTYRPVSELEAALKANPADFIAFLYLEYENGEGTVGKLEEVDNALWPEWNPKKAVTALL